MNNFAWKDQYFPNKLVANDEGYNGSCFSAIHLNWIY